MQPHFEDCAAKVINNLYKIASKTNFLFLKKLKENIYILGYFKRFYILQKAIAASQQPPYNL